MLALLGLFFTVYLVLGLLVDFSAQRISPETEQRWFKSSKLNSAIHTSLPDATRLEDETLALFSSLQQCAEIDIELHLWSVESETINAIAIPGGDIVVFSALTEKLKTENGLAFVLAHELAHFKNRDHLRGLGRGLVVALLSSLALGSDSAITNFINPVAVLGHAGHSRSREAKADASALDILHCHYGHVSGATELFELLLEEGNTTSELSHYFSSHPKLRDRISSIEALVQKKAYSKEY
jgi:Zn-dependent protease with chaperone function